MDSGPPESECDSERTYRAFDSSEVRPTEERSLPTPSATEEKPRTPAGPRTRRPGSGSGSAFIGPWDDEDAIPADADGNLFGKYRVLRKLGDGGMGSVLLVEHVGLEHERALKIIKSEVADNETNRLRFRQEAKILAKLNRHPNAVPVHDTGFVGKFAYIEMDYQEGQTLRKRLEPGRPMPSRDVLWILGELCAVLGEAHRLGIVHRDVKPQNIMIVPDPSAARGERVKVLDFGIAKIVRDAAYDTAASLTQDNDGLLGTIPYSSPEQLGLVQPGQTQAVVDHRSDIYSLGVLLYEMLAGARPFSGTQTKILHDHAYTPPPPFIETAPAAGIPPAVEAVVRRCLEKNPADRPQSVRELFESLSAAVAAAPSVAASPTPAPEPPPAEQPPILVSTPTFRERRKPPLLRRKRAILGGLGAAAIILGAAALAFRGREPSGPIGSTHGTNTISDSRKKTPTPTIPEGIAACLRKNRWEPIPGGKLDRNGWPPMIQQVSGETPRKMRLSGNCYLPEDCEPDTPSGTVARGLPKVLKTTRTGSLFIRIDGGEFWMGNFNEKLRPDEKRIPFDQDEGHGHSVTLSSFYMQKTEVSIDEFDRFCREMKLEGNPEIRKFSAAWENLAGLKGASREKVRGYPATGVSRRMARRYARWIGGDLPTEAQWEFAARSRGKLQRHVWRDDIQGLKSFSEMANVANWDRPAPCEVEFEGYPDKTEQGIHHMTGNVREWCRNPWKMYRDRPEFDPGDDLEDDDKEKDKDACYAIRGGSYATMTDTARVTWRTSGGGFRYCMQEGETAPDLGFRVVLRILECPADLGARPDSAAWSETRP